MSKSKHFVFVAAIMVTILLIIGSWAAPVQANSGKIIIPTPTGTLSSNPNDHGEPVAAEQQEELKSVIQAYFEMRYDALSASHPHGFHPEGFGDLVSTGTDAKTFLDAELGKLALEIKYAELNHSRYVNYKYFLTFNTFSIDVATQLVTVAMVEDNEIISENSAVGNPANPHVAQMFGLKHTIVLRKEQNKWRIVSDDYNDFLWRTLRQNGKSTEKMRDMLSTVEAQIASSTGIESAGTAIASPLPDDPSSHTYDRAGAVYYAIHHATAAEYNLDYPSYDDGVHGDCTNFVSQALYEGGNVSMYIPTPPPTPYPNGQSGWYLLNDMLRATDWNQVNGFYTFVNDRSTAITEGPEGYELGPVPEGQVPSGLMIGDIIQYNEEDDAEWEHSAIVVDFDQNNGDPLVASHSPNFPSINFRDVVSHVKMRFIHIERSDGYPPIKVQTSSIADDAGGNPGGTCPLTNSDPGNNYLGGCFNGSQGVASGFLFRNIQIPYGAQIKYAYVNFTTDGPYTVRTEDVGIYEPISLQIYGENTTTPADFSPTNTPSQRTNLVTPPIPWPINRTDTADNITYDTWDWKGKRTTPDIANIIHSITSLGGWTPGNTLSLIFHNGLPGTTYARRVIALEAIPPNYSPARLIAAYDLNTNQLPVDSVAAQDGHVLESSETSSKGGSYNSNYVMFYVGDDSSNKQFRGILSFDTQDLPDNAIITSATLKIKQFSIVGTNPFTTHGNLAVDIKKPSFGRDASLVKSDFEDPAGLSGAATFDPTPTDSWYTATLSSAAFPHINLTGTTQFRLAFTLDDNNDFDSD